ncbi:hypothetical protein, partial [Pseudomonas syringae group genomosp. 7]|uniref:hypothetical protein n=1 Tax=Pseudomonas syringae group genomosp. 7 TaxID=251699 RepID=UPI00376F5497
MVRVFSWWGGLWCFGLLLGWVVWFWGVVFFVWVVGASVLLLLLVFFVVLWGGWVCLFWCVVFGLFGFFVVGLGVVLFDALLVGCDVGCGFVFGGLCGFVEVVEVDGDVAGLEGGHE